MSITPNAKPQATRATVESIVRGGWHVGDGRMLRIPDTFKAVILNVRGYFRDSMGKPGVNDPGIYDDACFLLTPHRFESFNANTDPSVVGWNKELGKPFAMLDEGIWPFIKGYHKGAYKALRQPDPAQADKLAIPNHGFFTVIRDDGKGRTYKDEGYHAINYHRGGTYGTSSWGCQTIPPTQYDDWLKTVYGAMTAHGQSHIPVMLINNDGKF